MGEKDSAWRGYVMSQLNGIERLLRKIAPQYGLVDGDVVTYKGMEGSAGTLPNAQRTAAVQRDWASLPPIQRTAGEMPLVAAPSHFVDTLPGSAGLPPIVEPLGHEVSPLATPGLVVARVRAVEAPAPGAIPAPAPVQRRTSRSASGTDAAGDAFDGLHEAFQEVAAADPPVEAPAPAAPPTIAAAPIRTMPTVSRQAIRVPDRPLTSAAAAAQPAPVQRAAAAAASAPAPGTPALPRPSGGMRRVPSPTPAVPTVSREAAQPQPAPLAAPTSAAPLPPTSAGPARRGLGEPLTSAPTSAKPVVSVMAGPVVNRSTTAGPLPIAASSLRPVAQRSTAGSDQSPALEPGAEEPGPAAAALPHPALRLPHLPVSRSVDDVAAAPVATIAAAPSSPAAHGPEIRPTTGANPLRTSLGIQRVAADDLHDGASDAELPSPWWSPASPAPAPDVAPLATGPASLVAAEPATIQRSAVGGTGVPTTAARVFTPSSTDATGQKVTAGRSAPVAAPIQRTVAQATRPGPLPQLAGAGVRSTSSVTARPDGGTRPIVTPSGVVLAPEPVVQTSPATPTTTGPAPSTFGGQAPAVQREESSAPAAVAAPATSAPSERDLDELAQALFGRIRGRLRNDLIYDREAKGLTFDNV